jgi:glucokinase
MSSTRAVIGVDVGGTGARGGVVDESGSLIVRSELPTDPTAATKSVLAIVEELLGRADQEGARIEAIGVGAAGFINSATGSVTFAPNLVYDDPQIANAIRSRTDLPVVVDNDGNAAAWGERRFGTAKGCNDVVLVAIGTGIGGGIIAGGSLIRGATGAGAEIGHIVIDPSGPECHCGLRGCLEEFASGRAIARMGRTTVDKDPSTTILAFAGSVEAVTAEHVAKAALQMDEAAREILRAAGISLGIGLSNMANLFDPEVMVLRGSVIKAREPFLGPARDQLAEMMQAQRRRPMRLDVSTLGKDGGIIGGAALAFDVAHPSREGGVS